MQRPPLEPFKCSRCSRLAFKISRDALRPGALLEHKCSYCNAFTYLVGPDEEPPARD